MQVQVGGKNRKNSIVSDYINEELRYEKVSFGENLRNIRKQRNVTQEQLAEMLGVSRQAISKWESNNGYPETEKLIVISKSLNISIDYLLNDESVMETKERTEEKNIVYASIGKIAITTYDKSNVVVCQSVKSSSVLWPGKDEPKYVLNGIDKVTFWGEHAIILGWYADVEDIEKEITEIMGAIQRGENSYELKYNADIEEVGLFGSLKIKRKDV